MQIPYLVDVLAEGAVAPIASRTWATLPGPIRRAAALHPSEAGAGQTSIWQSVEEEVLNTASRVNEYDLDRASRVEC